MLIVLADNVLVGPKLCEMQRCEKFEMFVLALSNDDDRLWPEVPAACCEH